MKQICIILLLTASKVVLGQNLVNSFYKYDTLLYIADKDKAIRSRCVALSTSKSDKLWVFVPDLALVNEKEELKFRCVNLKNHTSKEVSCYVPSVSFKIRDLNVRCMAASEEYLVLYLQNILIVLNNKNDSLSYNNITPFYQLIEYMSIEGNNLFLGKAYNSHPMEYHDKTFLAVYDLKKQTVRDYRTPEFKNIELTQYAPRNFYSFSGSQIAFSQSSIYDITIYNNLLKDSVKIHRDIKGFGFDSLTNLNVERAGKLMKNPKQMFDSLNSIVDTTRRIATIQFLNDSTLLVTQLPHDHKKDWCVLLDIWRKEKKIWKAFILDKEYCEFSGDSSIINAINYPISLQTNNIVSNGKYMIIPSEGSPIEKYGKTPKEFFNENESFYRTEMPSLRIEIFKSKD